MFINEVVHKIGLSRKSIRYYESVGLLNPTRNRNNDYREYTEEDIKKLKVIKFLRELNVPIKDLQLLDKGEITLQDCMQDRVNKINTEEEKYQKVKNMCIEISKSNDTIHNINIDTYFKNINQLNKDGFTMRNVKTNHTKKIIGALISSLIFETLFIGFIILLSYFQFTEIDKVPWGIYIFINTILILPASSIIINLIRRIKEIKGGEEDEASKY